MSILIKTAGTSFADSLGLVDMPNKAAWRRAHFTAGSAQACRVNLAMGGANPLTVVGAPTFAPGYAIVNAANGFVSPDATPQLNRTAVIVTAGSFAPNSAAFQGGLYMPAFGLDNPDVEGFQPLMWWNGRYNGFFNLVFRSDGGAPDIEQDYTFKYPTPVQRPDGTIDIRHWFAIFATTTPAGTIVHITQGPSLLRRWVANPAPTTPPDQPMHVGAHGGIATAMAARQAVAFMGELPAQGDAAIDEINDWLWSELLDVGVRR